MALDLLQGSFNTPGYTSYCRAAPTAECDLNFARREWTKERAKTTLGHHPPQRPILELVWPQKNETYFGTESPRRSRSAEACWDVCWTVWLQETRITSFSSPHFTSWNVEEGAASQQRQQQQSASVKSVLRLSRPIGPLALIRAAGELMVKTLRLVPKIRHISFWFRNRSAPLSLSAGRWAESNTSWQKTDRCIIHAIAPLFFRLRPSVRLAGYDAATPSPR